MNQKKIITDYILKKDLINKLNYKNNNKTPALQKIHLNFGCKTENLKNIAEIQLALQLITSKQGEVTLSRKPSLVLKLKKNSPTGAKACLRKKLIQHFLTDIFLKTTLNKGESDNSARNSFEFTVNFSELLLLEVIGNNQQIFKRLPSLNVSMLFNKQLNKIEQNILTNYLFI